MKSIFVETTNVSKFRAACLSLEDTERGQPGIGLAWGQAGRGKTFAAQNYHSERGGVFLRAWEGWTQTAFLSALCFEVCGVRPRSANGCKVKIMHALNQDRRTVFIDEADRLHISRIEDLRDIHDETGCPIVLIGEEELIGALGERRRIWSRVTQEVKFEPSTETDIIIYSLEAADLDIDPEAAAFMRRQSDGDFRLIHSMTVLLEQAAKARQTSTINVSMVHDVVAKRSWRRG